MADNGYNTVECSQVKNSLNRVFAASDGFIRVLLYDLGEGDLACTGFCGTKNACSGRTRDINTVQSLKAHIEQARKENNKLPFVYIVPQRSTWSRLDTSWELMQEIMKEHGISDQIFEALQAFQSRTRDIQQYRWSSCTTSKTFSRVTDPFRPEQDPTGYHLCYRIQYPMPNNRDWGDPFSIRQTAVYQAHFDTEQPDTWILIRPTTAVQRRLFADLERSIASCRRKDPVCYHVNFLSSTTAFWEDYIEYLRDRLDQYRESVCFSRVGRDFKYPESDYKVTFKDCQDLEHFQGKYARLMSSIEANTDAIQTCRDLWESSKGPESEFGVPRELSRIERQLSFYRRRILDLSKRAQGTAELLHRILDFQHSKDVNRALNAIDFSQAKSSATLEALTQQTQALANLQQARDKDSKMVKALTAMSTLYLPASLVATIFSQNLVQLLPNGKFAPARQSWIPLVSAVVLIVVTFLGVVLLERIYRWTRPKPRFWA